jgi:hypothetical protein
MGAYKAACDPDPQVRCVIARRPGAPIDFFEHLNVIEAAAAPPAFEERYD